MDGRIIPQAPAKVKAILPLAAPSFASPIRSGPDGAAETQLVRHAPHGLDHEGDVLVQVHPE